MLHYEENLSQRLALPLNTPPAYKDTNNNTDGKLNRGDKYSLRPRSLRRRHCLDEADLCSGSLAPASVTTISAKSSASATTTSNQKNRTSKPKQKAAPLSKYRRKTANARERGRMREINMAFEELRKAVPQMITMPSPSASPSAASTSSATSMSSPCSPSGSTHSNSTNEKLTKITTLRLAMKYISTLSAVLSSDSGECGPELLSDCSELESLLLESDGESLPRHSDFSDHSLTPADFCTMDFTDDSLTAVDFTPLSPDLSHHLTHFDPFLSDFS